MANATIDLEPEVATLSPAADAGRTETTRSDSPRAAARMSELRSMMDGLLGTIDLAMLRNSGGQ